MSSERKAVAAEQWRKALLPAGATLRQAIHNLDESALQIILVASEDGSLIGTLTDGDIRRGLLRGMDLGSIIDSLVSRSPLVVYGCSVQFCAEFDLMHNVPPSQLVKSTSLSAAWSNSKPE